jgi:hypothetical protein
VQCSLTHQELSKDTQSTAEALWFGRSQPDKTKQNKLPWFTDRSMFLLCCRSTNAGNTCHLHGKFVVMLMKLTTFMLFNILKVSVSKHIILCLYVYIISFIMSYRNQEYTITLVATNAFRVLQLHLDNFLIKLYKNSI